MVETVSPDWVLWRALKMSGEVGGPWRTTRHPAACDPLINSPLTNTPPPSLSSSTITLWTSYVAVCGGNQKYKHNEKILHKINITNGAKIYIIVYEDIYTGAL